MWGKAKIELNVRRSKKIRRETLQTKEAVRLGFVSRAKEGG